MQMIAVRLKDQFRNVMQMWARTIQRGFYFADNRLRLTNQNIELRKLRVRLHLTRTSRLDLSPEPNENSESSP